MGFRFRKSVKLGKGVKLNLGRKSAGISVGGKRGGVSVNSRSGARARVSIPGTGISNSAKLSGGKKSKSPFRKTSKRGAVAHTTQMANAKTAEAVRPKNPPRPPKSPKIYFPCGIIMVAIGVFLLFVFWVLGLIAIAIGVYYITCGPKIYADLVVRYKEVHPEYEEGQ